MRNPLLRLVDRLIYAGALAGIVLSLWLLARGIAVFPFALDAGSTKVAIAGFCLLALVHTLFVLRMQGANKNSGWREQRKKLYVGCPWWMRMLNFAFFLGGVGLFFLPALFDVYHIGPHFDGRQLPSTLPGAFGLIWFSNLFMQLYAFNARSERREVFGVRTSGAFRS